MNKLIISGRFVDDPKHFQNESGTEWATFSIAVHKVAGQNEADFIPCRAFGKVCQIVMNYCRKGARVICEGSMSSNRYTNNEGKSFTSLNAVIYSIEFISTDNNRKKETEDEQSEKPVFTEIAKDALPF